MPGDIHRVSGALSEDREAPQATDAYLATIVRASSDAIIGLAGDGTIQSWNPAAERMFGYTPAEAIGRPIALLAPPDREAEQCEMMSRLRSGQTASFETVRIAKDGRAVHVQLNAAPVLDAAGQLVLIAATLTDITTRKRAEEALRTSEERYRALFDSIDAGFCVVEVLFDDHDKPLDYRFLEANPAFERQTGLVQAVGKRARELVPNLEAPWFETYGAVALTGESVRFEEGSAAMHRWFDVYAFRVGQPESRNVAILFNDITQRKRAEQALRESEARYRTLFENFPNGAVFLFDHALRYTLAGGTGLAATGLSRQMFEGKTLGEIFPPEIAARDEPVLRAALAGASTRVEVPFGTSTFVVDTLPVRDEQGTIVGGMVMTQDITERKHAEEERSRLLAATQAARAEAEAALQVRDAFLSIASHELRTPLTALQGYAGMLRNRIAGRQDGDAQTMRLADTLLRQVDRMNQLIGHLLDVSRLQHGQFAVDLVPMDLAALVTQIVDEFRLTLPAGAASPAIELTPPEDEVLVLGDPARLEEVVQNLLTNAVKYSPGGGIVRVRVTQQGADASVEVTDQGIGIPLEAQAHLFEPFYRAGNVDRRTSGFGIGLYVVREIVQGHGGRIVATSIEGQGSTFCVTLPVHDSSA